MLRYPIWFYLRVFLFNDILGCFMSFHLVQTKKIFKSEEYAQVSIIIYWSGLNSFSHLCWCKSFRETKVFLNLWSYRMFYSPSPIIDQEDIWTMDVPKILLHSMLMRFECFLPLRCRCKSSRMRINYHLILVGWEVCL